MNPSPRCLAAGATMLRQAHTQCIWCARYVYKIQLSNMKFGGASVSFGPEFTYKNYIIKW